MTDLNNLAPAAVATAAGASLPPPPAPASAPPALTAAAAPAAPIVAPSSDPVDAALRTLTAAIDAAHTAAIIVGDSSVGLLGAALADLSAALEDVASEAEEVGRVVSSALSAVHTPPATAPFVRMTGPWVAGALYGVVPAAPLTAIPESTVEKWFAITRGTYVGLTKNSAISLKAVNGISSALSDRCATQTEALEHFNGALSVGAVVVIA